MTTIPQDIITKHILYRLPAKSVGRFRCVSKEWLSLLTEPRFIQTHQKTLNRNHFFFRPNGAPFNDSLHSAPYNNNDHEALTKFRFPLYQIQFIQSSFNGLVLAFAYKNPKGFGTHLILNPTTKDYVQLPKSRLEEIYDIKGFGYDSVSDDYKVVMIKFDNNNIKNNAPFKKKQNIYIKNNVDVYSLKTNTWKHLSDSPYDDYISYNGPSSGLFANGFLHWICNIHSKPVIVAFSLADEKLSEVPPPNLFNEVDILSDEDTLFVALGEKLAIFNEEKGDIWLMNEYGLQKSWTRIVIHGFNEIPSDRSFFYDNGKLQCLTSNLLWIYDVEEQTFCKSVDISNMNIWRFEGGYAESLLSPKFSRST